MIARRLSIVVAVATIVAACNGELRLGQEPSGTAGSGGGASACDPVCNGIRECVGGACLCPQGTTACGEACFDLSRDPLHCGACTTKCNYNQVCSGGACTCGAGFGLCDFGEKKCVDLSTNPEHCGACTGSECGFGAACAGGTCQPSCPSGTTACPMEAHFACVDLQRDPGHCGKCDEHCKTGEVCAGGECRTSAPATPCAACPCATCVACLGTDAVCCVGSTGALCVAGPVCP